MGKNRTSVHRGKAGNADHNKHDFKEDKDVYWRSMLGNSEENKGCKLSEKEMEFYKQRYTVMLQEQNDRYKAKGNYSRVKTIKQLYESKRYKPTEEIIQYGHVGGHVPDRDVFNKMLVDYIAWKQKWSAEHGAHLHTMNYATHFDEATPHAHVREIWDYTENGIAKLGQEKAMEQAGLELPDPSQPVGRFNNRGMTYTAMCRNKWQDICEEYGFEVEREPMPKKTKHKTVDEYQDAVNREYFERREQEMVQRENELLNREESLKTANKALTERERMQTEKEAELQAREMERNESFEEWAKTYTYKLPKRAYKPAVGSQEGHYVYVKDDAGKVVWEEHTPFQDYNAHLDAKKRTQRTIAELEAKGVDTTPKRPLPRGFEFD